MQELTPFQRRVVDEYLVDLNGAAAVRRAGSRAKKPDHLWVRLTKKSHFKAALDEALARRAERTAITQDRVLEELSRIALADIGEVIEIKRNKLQVGDLARLPARVRASIAAIRQTDAGWEVKLHPKVPALELAMRHLGMLKDRVELTGLEELAERLLRYRQRVS